MKKSVLDYGIVVFKNGGFLLEDIGFILDERFEFTGSGMTDTKGLVRYGEIEITPGFNAKALTRGSYRKTAYTIVSGIKFFIEDLGNPEDEDSEQFVIKFSHNGDDYVCLQGYDVGSSNYFMNKEKTFPVVQTFMRQFMPS